MYIQLQLLCSMLIFILILSHHRYETDIITVRQQSETAAGPIDRSQHSQGHNVQSLAGGYQPEGRAG